MALISNWTQYNRYHSCINRGTFFFSGPSANYVLLVTYSGEITAGSAVYSTGDSVFIKFATDGSETDTGFYIGYEEGSVGKIPIIF